MISLKVNGLDELQKDFDRAASNMRSYIKWALAQSVNAVSAHAKELAPFITGTLRRSIHTTVESDVRGIVFQNPSEAPYGASIEYGTRPHLIQTVNRRVLADRRSGLIFGTVVNHPGTKAQPFMEPGLMDSIARIQGFFDDAVLKIIRDMAT